MRKFSCSLAAAICHHSRHGRLRLEVDDDGWMLSCHFCDLPVASGSDGMYDNLSQTLLGCGVEFEVICQIQDHFV